MSRARILLADDHAVVREGVVQLLQCNFDVVGAVGDGRTLVQEADRLRPDVVVLDVGMPLLNGIEAATQIRKTTPRVKLMFLTQHAGKEYIQAAFKLGVAGYLAKSAAASELVTAIGEVLAGHRFLSAELREKFGDPDNLDGHSGSLLETTLTPRQREVLQLIAEGKTAKEIASQLHISVKTVEFHKAAIMDELGMRTTAELTRYALEHRIVPS